MQSEGIGRQVSRTEETVGEGVLGCEQQSLFYQLLWPSAFKMSTRELAREHDRILLHVASS